VQRRDVQATAGTAEDRQLATRAVVPWSEEVKAWPRSQLLDVACRRRLGAGGGRGTVGCV
jgi:hypothetical protein